MQSTHRCATLIAVLLMACAGLKGIHAQQHSALQFRFGELGIENGLSQGMIFTILQDRRGFMWFGTKEGLNRYDGQEFRVYRNVPGDPLSLPDNYILALTEDTHGRLWLGTQQNGLVLFDPSAEQFTRVPLTLKNGAPVRSPIKDLSIDAEGYLYACTETGMMLQLDPRHRDVASILQSLRTWPVTRAADPNAFFRGGVDQLGRAYVIRQEGVFIRNARTHQWDKAIDFPSLLPAMEVRLRSPVAFAVSADSTIWIGGGFREGFVLYACDPSGKRVRDTLRFRLGSADLPVRDILPAPDSIVYLNASFRLIRYDRATRSYAVPPLKDIRTPFSENGGDIAPGALSVMYRDRSGVLWLGTTGWGLRTFNPQTLVFNARAGSLKQALYGDALQAINRFILRETRGRKSLDDYVFPFRTSRGDVWVGSMEDGLLHYRAQDGEVQRYGFSRRDPYSFLTMRVFTPYVDRAGRVWIGNWHGVSLLHEEERRWEHFFFSGEEPDLTRRQDNVVSWHEDADGTLWLGTISSGLVHFQPDHGSFRFYRHSPTDTASLSSDHVLTILADPEEPERYLWIGTDGGGLNRFDRRTRTFRHWGLKQGLPNPVVYGILADGNGMLWMSTNLGLSRFNPHTGHFWNFTERDGLQGNEFNRTEYAQKDALMYFGGTEGYNVFDPIRVRRNMTVPAVVITGMRIFDREIRTGDSESLLSRALSYTDSVTVRHDQNMITFEFAALDYFEPRRNRYRYRLDGLDASWIDAGTGRTATYTNLDPGTYRFHVIGANNHGIWNRDGATIVVTVLPPWWRTFWAYTVYGILLITFILVIDRLQRRRLIRRERERAQIREAQLRAEAAELEARAVRAENMEKQKELRVAAQIQQSIFPQTLPRIEGYELAGIHLPALEIGGDYYDCLALPDGTFALVIADVTGKGVPASLLVNSLQASVRISLENRHPLSHIAEQLNRFLYDTSPANTFVTCMIIVLQPETGALEILNAGHNHALLRRRDGSVETLKSRSLPLGCSVTTVHYPTVRSSVARGESLLLFTDGITEAIPESREPFGQDALEDFLAQHGDSSAPGFLDDLIVAVQRHTGGAEQSDDITALFLARTD